jgi:serine-type D-Ala-D-Ala carboxypeptidase (penicillin-binding protein 5/6)
MHNPGSQPARWLEHAPASDPGSVMIPGQDHRPGTEPRRRHRTKILALLAAGALCLAGFAIVQLTTGPAKPLPAPVVRRSQRLGAVAWPAYGESAAYISGVGLVPGPGAIRPVPIASVAKVMTAYVILRDHPLAAGASGPLITVRPQEAAAYASQVRNGDSLVPVAAGETITERQALEALLLPSADNMAWILARWDAGSQAVFVARMNTTARQLGMTATTYTDPSGLDASTTSTADDQARLGIAAMRVPALAAVVAMRTADIPVAGVVRNYNTLLGHDGITGLKTGSTDAAGGCVLLAAWRQAGSRKKLIIAATLGQPGTMRTMLQNALQAGNALVLSLDDALSHQPGGHPRRDRRESSHPDSPPLSRRWPHDRRPARPGWRAARTASAGPGPHATRDSGHQTRRAPRRRPS